MAKALVLRPLTNEEQKTLVKLARSQTAPARMVERAKTILLVHGGWCMVVSHQPKLLKNWDEPLPPSISDSSGLLSMD